MTDDVTHAAPKQIWAWPFNPGWRGGYYRERNGYPETDPGGSVYIRADLFNAQIDAESEHLPTALCDLEPVDRGVLPPNVEPIINRIHESKAGLEVRAEAIRTIQALVAENKRLRGVLRRIANNGREITYCRDVHEEAVLHARAALHPEAGA